MEENRETLPKERVKTLATKSLSALRSRKEQIIDTLEDIVGRDEMERLSQITQDHAIGGKSVGALSMAIGVSSAVNAEPDNVYSIWASRSVANLPESSPTVDVSPSNAYFAGKVPKIRIKSFYLGS